MSPSFFGIKNAKLFLDRKVSEKELGVREENGKLVIELEKKIPNFIHVLTLLQAFPLRQDILDSNEGKWPEIGPSTGPYQMVEHKFEQSIHLVQNPFYRLKAVSIPEVLYRITDEVAAVNLFDQNQLDVMTRISSLDLGRLRKQGRLYTGPFLATYYLSFNCRKPPFNERSLRQAVARTIQRDEIAKMLDGGESPAWGWIPKGLEGYIPYRDPKEVFKKPLVLTAEEQKKIDPIEAQFDSNSRNLRIMEKIQQDLGQNLKMKLDLVSLSWKSFHHSIQNDPPPLFRYAWMAPFLDPMTHLKVFTSDSMNNFSGCSDKRYDRLVDEIENLEPGRVREAKIVRAQQILLEEEVALVPLFHYVLQMGVSDRLKDFKVNSMGLIQVKDLNLLWPGRP
jgi:oligopeptide transport system substrate-binding protein